MCTLRYFCFILLCLCCLSLYNCIPVTTKEKKLTCPTGSALVGDKCASNCPQGWRNDGLFCTLPEYGRGAGFAWKFGDGYNDSGMVKRCENENGKGNCEKNGAIFYPKCKTGYSSIGCCICRPSRPDCSKFGLDQGVDLSCAKKTFPLQ